MSEEMFYALSSIAGSLSGLNQRSSWIDLTQVQGNYDAKILEYRTRFDEETRLLIEETDSASFSGHNQWQVLTAHKVDDRTEAVLLAARLTLERRELVQKSSVDRSNEATPQDEKYANLPF